MSMLRVIHTVSATLVLTMLLLVRRASCFTASSPTAGLWRSVLQMACRDYGIGRHRALEAHHIGVSKRRMMHGRYVRVQPYSCRYGGVRLYSSSGENDGDEKARIVFLGTPDVAADSLRSIVSESKKEGSPYEVVGVVTQPPKRRKRRGKQVPSPVGLVAEELDIPVLCPEKAKDPEFLDELENEIRPDLCITAAYGQYLPKRFLAMPKFGTLNIHPSLLPRWRGASPVQRSLQAGDNPVGVTVLFTVSKMDAGPIVSQKVQEIDENDQATTVLPLLFDIGAQCLIEALPDVVAGKITMDTAAKQDEEEVVNASMIDSSEGELKVWEESAQTCHNKVRGFSMWPGTYMFFRIGDDKETEPVKVKVVQTRVLEGQEEQGEQENTPPVPFFFAEWHKEPTDVVKMGPKKKDGLRVVCGDGSILELLQIQPVTRKVMDAKSFVNGLQGQTLRWVKTAATEKVKA